MSTIPASIQAASELASKVHGAALSANWRNHEKMTAAHWREAFRKAMDEQGVPPAQRRSVFARCCSMSGFGI